MNYETIILELLARVQKLEAELEEMKSPKAHNYVVEQKEVFEGERSYTAIVRDYIIKKKKDAIGRNERSIVLRAGDIEKAVGLKNRPVIVCNAMRQLMKDGDRVIEAPPGGNSTTVRIEYFLSGNNYE